jgi:nicotinamidase-related amidase
VRLERSSSVLLIIDVQERLMPVMHERAEVERNIERLIRGAHVLGVPVVVSEQYVKGLGRTVEPLRVALEETGAYQPVEKICFSAAAQLDALDRRQVLVAGVEAHVCVYQTASDLLARGLSVTLLADAITSRSAHNKSIAIQRLVSDGAKLSSTEMALFELLGAAGTDEFRAISKIVK